MVLGSTLDFSIYKDSIMAKGQQRKNKETKKPKKDLSAPKPVVVETTKSMLATSIISKGKLKK